MIQVTGGGIYKGLATTTTPPPPRPLSSFRSIFVEKFSENCQKSLIFRSAPLPPPFWQSYVHPCKQLAGNFTSVRCRWNYLPNYLCAVHTCLWNCLCKHVSMSCFQLFVTFRCAETTTIFLNSSESGMHYEGKIQNLP